MELRKLNIEKDRALYEEAWAWDLNYPRWYRELDQVFRPTLEEFLYGATEPDQADVGVFHESRFIALISFHERFPRRLEINLWARRKTCTEIIAWAAFNAIHGLFQNGALEISAWVGKRNTPVQKLCTMAGMKRDGVKMYRGESRGNPLEWLRYTVSV